MQYKDYGEVEVKLSKYATGERIALGIFTIEGEFLTVATTNLPEIEIEEGQTFLKTWSENEGILEWLIENKIVSEPIKWVKTGFVEAPLVEVLLNDGSIA